jgi:hypothetical protein
MTTPKIDAGVDRSPKGAWPGLGRPGAGLP